MQLLYTPNDPIEAQLLADRLEAEGIRVRIDGGYLQGAIGELPPGGLVRLLVEEAEHARAREIIAEWEAARSEVPESPRKPRRIASWTAFAFYLGLALGLGGMFIYYRAPASTAPIDYNDDGIADKTYHYSRSGHLLSMEADRNFDGRIDWIVHYDNEGLLKSSESDDDFNGTMETRDSYWRGQVSTVESDTDNDGKIDLRLHFVHGVLESKELIDAGGKTRRVEHFTLNRIVRAELDSDGDGALDTEEHYDRNESRISSGPIAH